MARTNFRLCFPEQTEAEREALLKSSIEIGLQTFLAFAEATSLPKSMFLRRFTIEGWEHVTRELATGKPIIFMIPHSWAIDLAGLYMTALGLPMCTMMHSAKTLCMTGLSIGSGRGLAARSTNVASVSNRLLNPCGTDFIFSICRIRIMART